jgi:two-component system NarL family sensor kinase
LVLKLGAAARDCTDPVLAAQLEETKAIGVEVLEEERMLAHTTHPRVLDELGLVAALTNLARHTTEYGGTTVIAEATPQIGQNDMPPDIALVLYRVAQEAVSNARRHGHALTVHLRLAVDDQCATLVVSDDGCGFDVTKAELQRLGMGLFTMRERVSIVDGRLTIVSVPQGGTRVVARIPIVSLPIVPMDDSA